MANYNRKDSSYFASTANLIKSSLIALLVSIILLITVILPAEYAIDPTGVGRVLNLTQMGEIKMSLAQEAEKEEKMTESMEDPIKESTQSETTDKSEAIKTDEKTFVLQPGEKMELKLEMKKDARVDYDWSVEGGRINYDAHGDGYPDKNPKDFSSYSKGKMALADEGTIVAAFDGLHGWFWRNRDNNPVTVTIRTTGEYLSIKEID